MREDRFNRKGGKKASTSDLRQSIAKIKPITRHGGKRAR
jgi:hypothetical protein